MCNLEFAEHAGVHLSLVPREGAWEAGVVTYPKRLFGSLGKQASRKARSKLLEGPVLSA